MVASVYLKQTHLAHILTAAEVPQIAILYPGVMESKPTDDHPGMIGVAGQAEWAVHLCAYPIPDTLCPPVHAPTNQPTSRGVERLE